MSAEGNLEVGSFPHQVMALDRGRTLFKRSRGGKQYVAEGCRIRDGIADQLLQGKRQFSPVRRATIPKPYGGIRELGIPTVTNRLIQQALL